MTDNVQPLNAEIACHYPKEGELAARMLDLIYEYSGEIGTAAALGVLQIVTDKILQAAKDSID